MADINSITGGSISLLPGMVATIEVEKTFINPGPVIHRGTSRELLNGFLVDDETIGTLSIPSGATGAVIEYKHLKSLNNTIWFYGRCGELGMINIVYVPIHDHATLATGGPAHAVYASEYVEEGS